MRAILRQKILIININPLERGLRAAAGLLVMTYADWGANTLWFLFGVVLAATGVSGWCPIYRLLGISTYSKKFAPGRKESESVVEAK